MKGRCGSCRHALESCTLQLHSWTPFKASPEPYAKKPCNSDRSTTPDLSLSLSLSTLSLADEGPLRAFASLPLLARKRRRRSVSGRSSDRSATTRRRCCGGSAAYATCSDFPLAAGGTDSSGEMFLNGGDGSWGSDVGESRLPMRDAAAGSCGGGRAGAERDVSGSGGCLLGVVGGVVVEQQGNDSGYGSETGYKGDAEFGYEDEIDEEEEDGKILFWRDRFGDADAFPEMKSHSRCRRKKQDLKVISSLMQEKE